MAIEEADLGGGAFAEDTPTEPAPVIRQRRRIGLARTPKPETKEPDNSTERKPRTRRVTPASERGKRKSLAGVFGSMYGGAGSLAERSGVPQMIPTARVLQWNAPVAGEAFDALIAGTMVDKMLQPLARRGDKLQQVGNVVGLPMIVYALTNKPELWPMLEPMARQMFYENLAAMGPVITAKRKRDQQVQKIVNELVDEGMLGRNDDGTAPSPDDLFAALFAPPPGMTQPEAEG